MQAKPRIVWIVDCHNWGWRNKFNALSALLPQYEHMPFALTANIPVETVAIVDALECDIVVCLGVSLIPFIHLLDRVVVTLSGSRILKEDYKCLVQ